jgi:hypothetical protein
MNCKGCERKKSLITVLLGYFPGGTEENYEKYLRVDTVACMSDSGRGFRIIGFTELIEIRDYQ